MAHKPKLTTKTPDDPATNGLIEAEPEIVAAFNSRKRANRHLAIVEIAATGVEYLEGGDRQAKVQIRHLEIAPPEREAEVEALFTSLHTTRTGNTTRPKHEDKEPEPSTPLDGLDDSVD